MKSGGQYTAPLRDYEFILDKVFELHRFSDIGPFNACPKETWKVVLEQAARLFEAEVAPRNAEWDRSGCTFAEHSVFTPPTFSHAYKRYVAEGWGALTGDPEYGGQGMPRTISTCVKEMMSSASMAFSITPMLNAASEGLFDAVATHEQKETWLRRILSGDVAVSMQMTEAHCGTDMSLLRTKAIMQDDGTYRLAGSKVWISGGEHDLTDNIVHLVLARIEGAAEGLAGISLFLVPKYLLEPDGSRGQRNSVFCTGIESKMGNHGNPTCFMSHEGSVGYLLGKQNRGLAAMFAMMNAVRLDVAIQGIAVAETAYQRAFEWAASRRQGRSLEDGVARRYGSGPQPILVHPDVRRTLMEIRCITEAGRFLAVRTAIATDLASSLSEAIVAETYRARVAMMTPMLKTFFSEFGVRAASDALQLFGGAGYTRHIGMEQLLRDARLGMIYEGANGIQAFDLVRRKLIADQGDAMFGFIAATEAHLRVSAPELDDIKAKLQDALRLFERTTRLLVHEGMARPEYAAAASMPYLHLFAYVAMADGWLAMARAAVASLKEGSGDAAFYRDKLLYAAFFYEQVLPNAYSLSEKVKSGCATVLEWPNAFATAS
jgi:alkylation response protein AidB-like acyl-CoA dehydrogenase